MSNRAEMNKVFQYCDEQFRETQENIKCIVSKLVIERDLLRTEVQNVREDLAGGGVTLTNSDANGHETLIILRDLKADIERFLTKLTRERDELQLQVQNLRKSLHPESAIVDLNEEDSQPIREFKQLLKSYYPVSLSDSEMLKLAAVSKLQTEIERRQNGNFC